MSDIIDSIFPSIKHSIADLIEDEDGNITRGKLLAIGTFIVLMSTLFCSETLAAHGSHSSHSSHSSHASTSYHRSHSSHSQHGSHDSHSSHGSHTSHSNTATHSNSNYSARGDLGVAAAPTASEITGVRALPLFDNQTISVPMIKTEIALPQVTPDSLIPAIAIPLDTPQLAMPSSEVQTPPGTPTIADVD